MENTLKNMVLSLFAVTVVCSASVALVHAVTLEPIAQAQKAATDAALSVVLPDFDKSEMESREVEGRVVDVYTATQGADVVGFAVKSSTGLGYSGEIVMMVGIAPNGELLDVSVLSQSETPGLGSKLTDPNNAPLTSVKGKVLAGKELYVTKDGGEVDALSGATISSRAFCDAVERAYKAVEKELKKSMRKEAKGE